MTPRILILQRNFSKSAKINWLLQFGDRTCCIKVSWFCFRFSLCSIHVQTGYSRASFRKKKREKVKDCLAQTGTVVKRAFELLSQQCSLLITDDFRFLQLYSFKNHWNRKNEFNFIGIPFCNERRNELQKNPVIKYAI